MSSARIFAALAAAALTTAALAAGPAAADDGAGDAAPARQLSNHELSVFLHQARTKPGAISRSGNDSCRWANDMECDEPDIGTGACRLGTDYSDCRYLRDGETDSCEWANDGECDEPGLGTGVCTQGADRTDCAGVAALRFRNDSCDTAFDGICEEKGSAQLAGPPRCAPRTDRADCVGRARPATINDHFQGWDDRQFVDTTQAPWRSVGLLDFDDETECTGTLVATYVVLTAAHCVHDEDGEVSAAGVFQSGFGLTGGAPRSRIVGYFVAPRFSPDLFNSSNKLDGTDWAYLRLADPLGDVLGVVPITPLMTLDGVTLDQAGYSWDTEGHLSAHLGCAATALNVDGTLEHLCDTTRGDSGSPLMVVRDGVHGIVAVDSNFRDKEDGPVVNIATRAMGFARYLDDFAAGRIGTELGGKTKK